MQLYKYLCIANTNAVTENFILHLYLLHDFCIIILKIRYKLHIAIGPNIHFPPPKIKILVLSLAQLFLNLGTRKSFVDSSRLSCSTSEKIVRATH